MRKTNPNNKQWPQVLATLSACLGLFCAGICFAWSSPSIKILTSENSPISVSSAEASWIASLVQLGSAISPIVGAILTKKIGPKKTVLISAIPYFLGFVLIIFSNSVAMLCISRLISGIAVGLSFSVTPIYVTEISESQHRGTHMVIFSISMSFGSLLISSVAPYVSIFTMAEIGIFFPVLMFVTFAFAPDSPLYYLRNNEESKALNALCQLRRQMHPENVEEEFCRMKIHSEKKIGIMASIKEFGSHPNPKALGIVCLIVICQQTCGAITSILYQESIFDSIDLPFPSNIAVVINAIISNTFALITMKVVDLWGRKPLLLLSAAGCIISDAFLGSFFLVTKNTYFGSNINILSVVGIVFLQVSFAIGLNSVPYTIAGEIFSSNSREVGMCITSTGGALVGFVVSKLYQIINDAFGGGVVFLALMSLTIVFSLFIYIIVPETKGKTFDEIQNTLLGKSWSKLENTTLNSIENISTITRF